MFAPEPGYARKGPPLPRRSAPEAPLIVTAIPEEYEAFERLLSGGERLRGGEGDRGLLRGRMGGRPSLLASSGDGPARAAGSISLFLRELPVSFVVGAGVAGALSSSLAVADIVAACRVLDEEGETPPPDADLLARAVGLGAAPAAFVTVARPVCFSKAKRDLASRLGLAGNGPAVVDMESSAWARACASRGVPFLLLRAVSDTSEEDLPGFLPSCLSPDGSIDRGLVARRLLRHPASLPRLLAMRARVRTAAARLADFTGRLLAAGA